MFLENLQGKALTVAITFACGTGFLLFGYDQGVLGGLLSNNGFLTTFGKPDATIQGQIVSTYDIGCIIGAFSSIFVGDILGRRRCIMVGCSIVIVGGALQSASVDLPMIIVARVITGCGNGLNTTVIPIWQSETSKANHRGRLICLQMVLVIFGIVVTNWMNFGFTYVSDTNPVTWRFPLAFQCFFALVTIFFVKFLPESPRWLVLKDRTEEARVVISRLIAKPQDDAEVRDSLKIIVDTVAHEASIRRDGLKEIFHGGRQQTFRRICLGAGASIFQQMGGINVVVYYLPIVLTQSFGFTPRLSLILSAVDFMSLCFWGTMAAFLIDRYGRRKLMLVGAFMDGVCFTLAAVGLSLGTKQGSAMAVAFIFLYFVFYGMTLLAIPFMYPAEINSQHMRNTGSAIAMLTNWLFVYVVVLMTPSGIANLGWRFYLIFGILNFSFVPVIYYFYIETANLTLEEIDTIFEIKHDGGKDMTYKEATRLAHVQAKLRRADIGMEKDGAIVKEVEEESLES